METFDTACPWGYRRHRNLKEMVAKGITPLGMGVALASPFMVDIAAAAGFDYIGLDLEHNAYNPETLQNIIRAADGAGMATVGRVNNMALIQPLLDFGMVGFTVPHVRSAQQAREIVDAVKFAPVGRRGFCTGGRAMWFGALPFEEYMHQVEDEVTVTVMIEDKEGIENYLEILDVPGIDYVAAGSGDISQALGLTGQTKHPDVLAVRRKILDAALERGIKSGATGAPVCVAEDKSVLLEAVTAKLAAYRKAHQA